MTQIHRLPSTEQAEREAIAWVVRLNHDQVSTEDRTRFEQWRNSHPIHKRAYEELSETWREFAEVGPLVRAVSFGQVMNDATRVGHASRRGALAAAAAVVGLLIGGLWYAMKLNPDTRFQTAIGERASVSLPDGSTLELNSNSLARLDFSQRARVVRLEHGEAFFKVQHDPNRPFWVVAGNSWVRAVGTAFSVYLRPSGMRVVVSEGAVQVGTTRLADPDVSSEPASSQAVASLVRAGKQVEVRGGVREVRALTPDDLARAVAWRSGTLYYENEPLGDVVDELNRYTPVQIVVRDDSLRELPIGGLFEADAQGAEALLEMLEDGFGLAVERSGQQASIERPR
jgi:transmembrane sensor